MAGFSIAFEEALAISNFSSCNATCRFSEAACESNLVNDVFKFCAALAFFDSGTVRRVLVAGTDVTGLSVLLSVRE